jgi:spore maturation protein CgeB
MIDKLLRNDLPKEINFLDPLHSPGHITTCAREKIKISFEYTETLFEFVSLANIFQKAVN